MKTATVVGVLLIAIGVLALAFQGITWTTEKKILDIGPIEATREKKHTIPLPPVLGALALAGGVALVIRGTRAEA